MNHSRVIFTLICISFFIKINAQQVFMQGWYWDYPKTSGGHSWADTLRIKAGNLKTSGFTHVWFPPHTVASFGNNSNGYDPKDLFIGNQTTGLGTRAALDNMLDEFTAQGIAPVADMIYNHRDGGSAEENPPVKSYITNYYTAAKEPFPSDRFRCILPLGGSTGNGAGEYYFKISSKTGDIRFNNFGYKVYMQTSVVGYQGLPNLNEVEPNGGGDCGQANNNIFLGKDMIAAVETTTGCNTDEFHLHLSSGDFNAAGDTLVIFLNNTGGYSDHRIYGIYSSLRATDIVNDLQYQTYTNFTNMPSGRGQMNYDFFKPNTVNASTTYLNGDWDAMNFFYDYDQFQKKTADTLIEWTKWNWNELGVRGLRMDAVKHFTPAFVGHLLDSMHLYGMNPGMVVGEWYSTNTAELNGWITSVKANMSPAAQAAIQPKIFDFALREQLRQACDVGSYDSRNIFNNSLHDAAALSGYNIVTFANNHDFRDGSGFASLIHNNPNLAYTYLLTNNQLGVPTVFYPDYYGYPAPSGGLYLYHPTNLPPYKTEIDKLILALKLYINGSPSVDYLNRFSTPYSSNFIQGTSNKSLIYQLQGHAGNGNREVICAINFGGTTLKVDHGINTRGGTIPSGTIFTDILSRSAFPYQTLSGTNQVYIELPPYSYSVWVQATPCAADNIILTSSIGSNAQTVCVDSSIVKITYSTLGATGATITGLPAGVTGSWLANVVTISGTPSVSGTFSYLVTLTGGCNSITATGTLTVLPENTVSLTSATGTNTQTVCVNTGIINITYATTGATGANFSGFPAGVTGSWMNNAVTILGIPTTAGTYNYIVTLTGGDCGVVMANGSIIVKPRPSVINPSIFIDTIGTAFNQNFTASGGLAPYSFDTDSILPNGLSLANGGGLSGIPLEAGSFPIVVLATDGNNCIGIGGVYNLSIICNPFIFNSIMDGNYDDSTTWGGCVPPNPLPSGNMVFIHHFVTYTEPLENMGYIGIVNDFMQGLTGVLEGQRMFYDKNFKMAIGKHK